MHIAQATVILTYHLKVNESDKQKDDECFCAVMMIIFVCVVSLFLMAMLLEAALGLEAQLFAFYIIRQISLASCVSNLARCFKMLPLRI